MVTFEKPPTDEELRSFADPQGASIYVHLEDDGTTLTGRPRWLPMWFVWACLLIPFAVGVGSLIWMNPFADPDPLVRLWGYLAAVALPVILVLCRVGIGWLIRMRIRPDDFFTLDRAAGTLTLPRTGVVLRSEDVVELVEVHGWHRVRDGEGWSNNYIRELSALTRGPDGALIRYPVLAAGHAKPVGRVAAELGELFGVPRRKLVEALFFGGWRRAD
ncbi:MAG TPA: hypothetical protein VKE74_12305 [Gemmataceae bacterium]|nr:hypothetical protein [Gemmataceae bacterium]